MIRCPALLLCLIVGLTFPAPAPAGQADYLSRLETDIVREHNLARENPGRYATHLEALQEFFNGRLLELPGEIALRTEEGVRAVDEAIRCLRVIGVSCGEHKTFGSMCVMVYAGGY